MTDERMREVVAQLLFAQANEVGPEHDPSVIMEQWRALGGLQASFVREFERRADAICAALRAAGYLPWNEAREACAKVADTMLGCVIHHPDGTSSPGQRRPFHYEIASSIRQMQMPGGGE